MILQVGAAHASAAPHSLFIEKHCRAAVLFLYFFLLLLTILLDMQTTMGSQPSGNGCPVSIRLDPTDLLSFLDSRKEDQEKTKRYTQTK